mgnify:CR=1 FL=1
MIMKWAMKARMRECQLVQDADAVKLTPANALEQKMDGHRDRNTKYEADATAAWPSGQK